MFGASMFGNDPFFSAHMQQMDAMMQSPLMGMNMGLGSPMLEAPERRRDLAARQAHGAQRDMMLHQPGMMDPFGAGSIFGGMLQNPMSYMQQAMDSARSDPNSHFMSQSSVMTFSNTGDGPPKVYQATTATRQAPGGIRETKKSVRDSEAAIEKMSVGRYLGDRAHVMEKQRNTRTGDLEENQEFQNLDEEEIPEFDAEWRGRTHPSGRQPRPELARSHVRAITDGQTRSVAPHQTSPPQHQNSQQLQYHPQRDRSRSNPRQYVPSHGQQAIPSHHTPHQAQHQTPHTPHGPPHTPHGLPHTPHGLPHTPQGHIPHSTQHTPQPAHRGDPTRQHHTPVPHLPRTPVSPNQHIPHPAYLTPQATPHQYTPQSAHPRYRERD